MNYNQLLHKAFSVKMNFVGDIMLARGIGDKIKKNNSEIISPEVYKALTSADAVCCNLECPIVENARQSKPGLFRAPARAVELLRGFDVVGLANNHIYDCGDEGIDETINILEFCRIRYMGIGKSEQQAYQPVIIEKNEKRCAFFACAAENLLTRSITQKYFIATLNNEALFKAIKIFRKQADIIVIAAHGGNEYVPFPHPEFREALKKLAHSGADLIVTHHPHVLGGYEYILSESRKTLIWYSLGDFIFDSKVLERRKTCMLEVKVGSAGVDSFNLTPIFINDKAQLELAKNDLRDRIITRAQKISKTIVRPDYNGKYLIYYFRSLFLFQIERLCAIFRYEGAVSMLKFLFGRIQYVNKIIAKKCLPER